MATFDVTIVESKAYTYRVEAKSGYMASAKAMMEHVDDDGQMPIKVEMVKDPEMSKPTLVVAEGQDPLPFNGDD